MLLPLHRFLSLHVLSGIHVLAALVKGRGPSYRPGQNNWRGTEVSRELFTGLSSIPGDGQTTWLQEHIWATSLDVRTRRCGYRQCSVPRKRHVPRMTLPERPRHQSSYQTPVCMSTCRLAYRDSASDYPRWQAWLTAARPVWRQVTLRRGCFPMILGLCLSPFNGDPRVSGKQVPSLDSSNIFFSDLVPGIHLSQARMKLGASTPASSSRTGASCWPKANVRVKRLRTCSKHTAKASYSCGRQLWT
jgi:hypothetical protein